VTGPARQQYIPVLPTGAVNTTIITISITVVLTAPSESTLRHNGMHTLKKIYTNNAFKITALERRNICRHCNTDHWGEEILDD
jgi:RNase P subunit RPR2